jgi:signal transduction histidine kinase
MRGSFWLRGVFYLLAALCLAQLLWWTYFAFRASGQLEEMDLLRLEARAFHAVHSIEGMELATEPSAEQEHEHEQAIRQLLETRYPELELRQVGEPVPADMPIVRGIQPAAGQHYLVAVSEKALTEARDKAERTRRMFIHESIAFLIVVIAGVLMIRVLSAREAGLRAQHDRFLTGATHELKTPLASLRLGLQSFEQGSIPGEKVAHYAKQMVEQVDRLEMDVENLLRSAAGRDKLSFEKQIGNLREDVDAVALEFAERFGAYGIRLETEGVRSYGEHPLFVLRDRNAIRQVLRNLIDNACKYSPRDGHIHLQVTAQGKNACVRVRDHGPGVSAEDREQLFERFFRGSHESGDSKGGTGLGLWLSRRIARTHDGELRIVDIEGQGACFELRLPLVTEGATV